MPDEDTVAKAEWTIMGFLAGDNNLNEEMVLTLQEIVALSEKNTIWPRVKILAQLDPSGLGLPLQRYVFDTPNHAADKRRYLETYAVDPPVYDSNENTGNPKALSGFVKWAVEEDPHKAEAERYMLILSGHGSGSTEDFLMKDENPVDSLSIPELEEALDDATKTLGEIAHPGEDKKKKIDILGMDCCFMGMVEVCYQIRDYVDHVVAAESLIPDFGWPYHRILAKAEEVRWPQPPPVPPAPPVEPEKLAEIIVSQFVEYYSDYDRTAGRSVDLAWIKLAEMDALKDSISSLGEALLAALLAGEEYEDQIILAHWEAQTYKFDQFVDIRDFCEITKIRFEKLPPNDESEAVIQACTDVIDKLDLCVMLSGCSGFAYQHSYGLSIYFPWAYVFDSYKWDASGPQTKFEFAKNNKWVDFLGEYVLRTRRDPRDSAKMVVEEWANPADVALEALGDSWNLLPEGQRKKLLKGILKSRSRLCSVGGSSDLHAGSRYHRSRYHRSRYHRSRWPGDREKSMKNFTPLVGKAYHPYLPPVD